MTDPFKTPHILFFSTSMVSFSLVILYKSFLIIYSQRSAEGINTQLQYTFSTNTHDTK